MELPCRSSPRAQRYDYTAGGVYFITICTKDREHFFGEIKDNEMMLNDLGKLCEQEINNLNERKTVNVHEWIIMPNHVHLLLGMDTRLEKYQNEPNKNGQFNTQPNEPPNEPRRDASIMRPNEYNIHLNEYNLKPNGRDLHPNGGDLHPNEYNLKPNGCDLGSDGLMNRPYVKRYQ
jgi:REP element-mobilizing transposase RayT